MTINLLLSQFRKQVQKTETKK